MKLYWPNAKFRNASGAIDTISTSDGAFTLEEAKNQLDIWRNDYGFLITEFWVDVYGDGCQRCERINVDLKGKSDEEHI